MALFRSVRLRLLVLSFAIIGVLGLTIALLRNVVQHETALNERETEEADATTCEVILKAPSPTSAIPGAPSAASAPGRPEQAQPISAMPGLICQAPGVQIFM